ncbi:MAG: 4-hydroxy-tetrahydrodipicolinate reductase [Rickettsiaceae bacterium]|nr:4-hydroxy-tetrahydrodipicolinate reductase [Rickettsiaceae bacterium]
MILGIYGYGKMGGAIENLYSSKKEISEIVIFEEGGDLEGFCLKADLIVDFSTREGSSALLTHLVENSYKTKAILIGTTALSPGEHDLIKTLAQNHSIMSAPNVSFGANLIANISKKIAKILSDAYDIDIVESHHRHKIDSPSGTALMIASSIKEEVQADIEANIALPRENKSIRVNSIRAGSITGKHEVIFTGPYDSISITHTMNDRNLLASSALDAILWLATQKPGLYSINNMFGL